VHVHIYGQSMAQPETLVLNVQAKVKLSTLSNLTTPSPLFIIMRPLTRRSRSSER
jgi:hypothetical protein